VDKSPGVYIVIIASHFI